MNERIKELEKLATPRCYDETGCYIGNKFDVEKFAELVAAQEREACAKVADGYIGADPIAAAIRARGTT